jgi:hypothetical protein
MTEEDTVFCDDASVTPVMYEEFVEFVVYLTMISVTQSNKWMIVNNK